MLHTKTKVCQHEYGCLTNVILSFKATFKWSLIIKLLVFCLVRIVKIFKIRTVTQFKKVFWQWKDNKDTLQFALVMGLMNCTYRAILCGFRNYYKNKSIEDLAKCDKIVAPIAGFCSGLWLYFDNKWRRNLFTILLISKAYDPMVNLISKAPLVEPIIEKQPFNKNHLLALVWLFASVLGQYTGFFEPLMMNASQLATYVRFCKKSYNDHMMFTQYFRSEGYIATAMKWEAKYVKL